MPLDADRAVDTIADSVANGRDFTFFLGAGASFWARAPLGRQVIEELTRILFREEHRREAANATEIDAWLDTQDWLRAARNDNETVYSAVMRRALPEPWLRRWRFYLIS